MIDKMMKSLLLEMMDEIDAVCRENDIRYYLLGGSMLGAVRHKGLIPWDDDIDIGMPRDDYEKFKLVAPHSLSSKFKFIYYQIDDKYHYFYGKVYHQETTLVEFEDPFYLGGVFIDVFPLDGLPSSPLLRKIYYKLYVFWNTIGVMSAYSKKIKITSLKTLIKKIIRKTFTPSFCFSVCEKITKSLSYNSSKYVGNYGGAWGIKEFTRKENFAEAIECEFENRVYKIPVGYDNILTEVYGNYMELPPIEKRISHHSHYYMNLNQRVSATMINNNNSK